MLFSRIYKLYISPNRHYIKLLQTLLGFFPGNIALYRMAFRHRSVATISKNGIKNSNERLEFLGDAVLGCVIAEELFKLYPHKEEGFLTEMRSKIVCRTSLNELSKHLGLDEFIEFNNQALHHIGKQDTMLGNAFEGLIGAIYIDKGYNITRRFIINRILRPHIDMDALALKEINFKSKLLEWCQHHGKKIRFNLIANEQTENTRLFTIMITIDEKTYATGSDYNKKNAEKIAAKSTCELLEIP